MTLVLNVAEPLLTGQLGKTAFDSVGPVLPIDWAAVGPGLLRAISTAQPAPFMPSPSREELCDQQAPTTRQVPSHEQTLLSQAREEDTQHWRTHHRPISAETLRKRLHIGIAKARQLVNTPRSGGSAQPQATETGRLHLLE
ncbi:hypothetical protein [Streptomyces sp. ODS28]|uniref:hypothetical protein n=1 Tax=Streptomyces sp. ODS28 TaxID=3136688 RepID=UPI0031EBAFA7